METGSNFGKEGLLHGDWVKNYVQWKDPYNPGRFMGVTCGYEYIENDQELTEAEVKNFSNSESLADSVG